MAGYVKVTTTDEVVPGQGKLVEVNGQKLALFNVDGAYYAIEDTCSHRGGPLSEGEVKGQEVECPWHGALFNIVSGEVSGPPADAAVTKYNVRVEGANIEVEV